MDVFRLRNELIEDYESYIKSFININDDRIREAVDKELTEGLLWPDPLIQINPNFEPGRSIDELVNANILHDACRKIFRRKKNQNDFGDELNLHKHQEDALLTAQKNENYVLTTGTGSGKSLAYMLPIVDSILKHPEKKGIKAIIVYPMNALANSQVGELDKYLKFGMGGVQQIRYCRYTGQETAQEKNAIAANPPDIILTNYVMLELMLTRQKNDKRMIHAAQGLKFLVLDELHTYRGRQGADIALLVRRTREILSAKDMQCIGTSATMSSSGSLADQKKEIAKVAGMIFGADFKPECIIGETLRRVTLPVDFADAQNLRKLTDEINQPSKPADFAAFVDNPLAVWIEDTLGLQTDRNTGTLLRAAARPLFGKNGAAQDLARLTGLDAQLCFKAIKRMLLSGYHIPNPRTGVPAFVFRLHQFISRGDTVYASLEPEATRYITTQGQIFVPGSSQQKVLLPIAFCRECGQPFFTVKETKDDDGSIHYDPKGIGDGPSGFLYYNESDPWPNQLDEIMDRLPDDWIEENGDRLRIKNYRRDRIPQNVLVSLTGEKNAPDGLPMTYIHSPFAFCPHCGVSYAQSGSNYTALSTLSSGGRSTDTTLLSLSLLSRLKDDQTLPREARKLLSFTDNRQDASLQAGHFNDFIETVLLRIAIFQAIREYPEGVRYDRIAEKVYDALQLDVPAFTGKTNLKWQAKDDAIQALQSVLNYRIYADLKRGWRLTSPNLEQCGLLSIEYRSVREIAEDQESWQDCHPNLAQASPQQRENIMTVLLDSMRRELAINIKCLTLREQNAIIQKSNAELIDPWRIDEDPKVLQHSVIFFPCSKKDRQTQQKADQNKYLGERSRFARFLNRKNTFSEKIPKGETPQVIEELFKVMESSGLVSEIRDGSETGYQMNPAAMTWMAADGTSPYHDPLRSPRASSTGGHTNDFFVNFYQYTDVKKLHQMQAREHTAQVTTNDRELREAEFRKGELPLLFCSPTMEVGVDISLLNAVNMRNVPPTPANYAQRSGRAGRSGQPALVFTYCTIGSPHDQFYFKRQQDMVSGHVSPPRIDLANEDMLRSHIQAVWLYCASLDLGQTMKDVIDLTDEKALLLKSHITDALQNQRFRTNTRTLCRQIIESIKPELEKSGWWNEAWLDMVCSQIEREFEVSCERWRSLYHSARNQEEVQGKIYTDRSLPKSDRDTAGTLQSEAHRQLDALVEGEGSQSDFYPYRYFASEGFLPGYSFPRLPVSAFIPGQRGDEKGAFLQRPRFLAISEFGPRAIIYHEGSRYIINKVNLPFLQTGEDNALGECKICDTCGYIHPILPDVPIDVCENCGSPLNHSLHHMFRMTSVSTRRRDHITSDEEERMRLSYELITGYRWSKDQYGKPIASTAVMSYEGEKIVELTYGQNATLWRINKGWRNREDPNVLGFDLDMERGYWKRTSQDDAADSDDPTSAKIARVIPYVEDRKNSLLFRPLEELSKNQIISFSAAFLKAVQAEFQLEDSELSADMLPAGEDTYQILFYESAEGGAGVLRRLVEEKDALSRVARKALEICHFDPDSGEDLHRAEGAREDCEAACYDCLMSYYNQSDHKFLNRHEIRELLLRYSRCQTNTSPVAVGLDEHFQELYDQAESSLEKEWLQFIRDQELRLPERGQFLLNAVMTRTDFFYQEDSAVIFVDGPVHDMPEQREKDRKITESLEDCGYLVIRFPHDTEWKAIIDQFPSVFGKTVRRGNS